jgi:hypothetical protein
MRPLSDLYDRGVYGAVLIAEAIRNARRLPGRRAATGKERRHGAAGQHEQPAVVDDGVSGEPDLLCMGLFSKKQFRVPPPSTEGRQLSQTIEAAR